MLEGELVFELAGGAEVVPSLGRRGRSARARGVDVRCTRYMGEAALLAAVASAIGLAVTVTVTALVNAAG